MQSGRTERGEFLAGHVGRDRHGWRADLNRSSLPALRLFPWMPCGYSRGAAPISFTLGQSVVLNDHCPRTSGTGGWDRHATFRGEPLKVHCPSLATPTPSMSMKSTVVALESMGDGIWVLTKYSPALVLLGVSATALSLYPSLHMILMFVPSNSMPPTTSVVGVVALVIHHAAMPPAMVVPMPAHRSAPSRPSRARSRRVAQPAQAQRRGRRAVCTGGLTTTGGTGGLGSTGLGSTGSGSPTASPPSGSGSVAGSAASWTNQGSPSSSSSAMRRCASSTATTRVGLGSAPASSPLPVPAVMSSTSVCGSSSSSSRALSPSSSSSSSSSVAGSVSSKTWAIALSRSSESSLASPIRCPSWSVGGLVGLVASAAAGAAGMSFLVGSAVIGFLASLPSAPSAGSFFELKGAPRRPEPVLGCADLAFSDFHAIFRHYSHIKLTR